MRKFVVEAVRMLERASSNEWVTVFVKLKMDFYNKYQKPNNLMFSTNHGIDFFVNILGLLNGKEWKEEGKTGDDFRKLREIALKESKGDTVVIKTIETKPKSIPVFKPTSEDLKEIENLRKGAGNIK